MGDSEAHDLLVAYDDTPAARRAVAFAVSRAERTGETVDVVHIGTDMTDEKLNKTITDAVDGIDGTRLGRVWTIPGAGADEENIAVSKRLSDLLAARGYTMLVMGNEERGLFHELLAGSVSQTLIGDQVVPILLVP